MTERHCIHGVYCKNKESCLSKRESIIYIYMQPCTLQTNLRSNSVRVGYVTCWQTQQNFLHTNIMFCLSFALLSTVGSRLTHVHLLSGGVLPLLSLLESTLTHRADTMALSKEARSLRVVRVRLDDGRRIIGIRYPLPLISEVASMLSMLNPAKQVIHNISMHI